MKLKRYFRGSRGVLVFVFLASVAWLLLDMLALRVSIDDASSQLLRARAMREGGAEVTRGSRQGFQHPVQVVELDRGLREAMDQILDAYRRNPEKRGHVQKNRRPNPEQQRRAPPEPEDSESAALKPGSDQVLARQGSLLKTQPAPAKKPVNLKPGESEAELGTTEVPGSIKGTLPVVVSYKSKVPPGVQGGRLGPLPPSEREPPKGKDAIPKAKETMGSKGAKGVGDAAEGVGVAAEGVGVAAEGVGDAAEGVGVAAEGVGDAAEGVGVAAEGVGDAAEGVGVAAEGVGDAAEGVGVAAKGVGVAAKGVGVAAEGVGVAAEGVEDAAKGVGVAAKGVGVAAKGVGVAAEARSGGQESRLKVDQPHSGKISSKHTKEEKQAKAPVRNEPDEVKRPPTPTIKPDVQQAADSKVNASVVRKPGVHKVLSLDVTHAPRDAGAVGQFGQAAVVGSDKEREVRKRWDEGQFNVYLSDQIPVDRAIPDTRPQMCAGNLVHDDLPTTSVIFCFVDEVWSTLLRSVHSVLNRSPPHLLKEIILVDDCSSKDYLKAQLDTYMSQFPKVRIVRLKERQGLIRARLAGAAIAKGEVLTFLDSHVECNVGWLEPLLERVYLDRKKVACPVIEVINDKDMSYVLVDNFQRGIFKWPLVFGWSTLPEEYIKKNNMTIADPIRCPVMAGGLFSIDKKYFYELGAYDPGLDVWGGENMEISFKIWMCGGEIEIIPCSRVGHIFRGQNPYKFPKDRQKTVERNLARVAEVWLDEYKDLFYGHGYHHLLDKKLIDIGNLTEQIELRKRLKCKSFRWYLENVYQDFDAPLVKAEGPVLNRGLRKCLALQKGSLSFEQCDLSKQSQRFNYTWMRHVRQQDLCIAPQGRQTGLALEQCDGAKPNLRWFHKASSSSLGDHLLAEIAPHDVCLEAGPQGNTIYLNKCEPKNAFQKWQFTNYYTHRRG